MHKRASLYLLSNMLAAVSQDEQLLGNFSVQLVSKNKLIETLLQLLDSPISSGDTLI